MPDTPSLPYRTSPLEMVSVLPHISRFGQQSWKKLLLVAAGFLTSAYAWLMLAVVLVSITSSLSRYNTLDATGALYERIFPGGVRVAEVLCVVPFLWLAAGILKPTRILRVWWVLLFFCLCQWFFGRACHFCVTHFQVRWTAEYSMHGFPDIVEVREKLSSLDGVLYGPILHLVESGYGIYALLLHSLVLGAFWTLAIYGLYRLARRLVPSR